MFGIKLLKCYLFVLLQQSLEDMGQLNIPIYNIINSNIDSLDSTCCHTRHQLASCWLQIVCIDVTASAILRVQFPFKL